MKPHKKIILIATITLGIIVGGIITFQLASPKDEMREVKSFHLSICQAFMPECGVCPGEMKEGKCYVKRGTFEQYP